MSLTSKYRPTSLTEVIGQKHIVNSFNNRFGGSKAFLFVGPSGTGKTTIARILADKVCGGKADVFNLIEFDAATNSGAEAVRDIVSKANSRALGASPNKVIIMDECHRLSAAAWSSLLKPIEEPPPHVWWCLCTTEVDKVPKTIKTRCVTHVLNPVEELEIFNLLFDVVGKEGLKTPEDVLELIAESCGGSPRQALTNLELCSNVDNLSQARELLRQPSAMKGPVDLARLILDKKRRPTWADVTKCIAAMENVEAETVRIIMVNYISAVAMKAKSEKEAAWLLGIIECFNEPYRSSDKLAPLLLSVGAAIGVGE